MKTIAFAIVLSLAFAWCAPADDFNYPTPNVDLDVMIRSPHWDGAIATAHNGGILFGPQDTIIAFSRSCDCGADIIEVDIRITADGELITFHDEEFCFVNSTGTGLVRERTLAYVRSIKTISLVPGVPDQPIPTFREALQFLKQKRVCLNVEPKDDDAIDEIIQIAGEEGMLDNILIQAKSPDKARLIRSFNTSVGIIANYHQESDIDAYAPYHPEVMEVEPEVTDTIVARIKSLGIKVQMKTGYLKDMDFDEKSWQQRIARGVNVALTDLVPEMVRFLRRIAFNAGSEARPREGAKGLTGCTYLNIAPEATVKQDGRLKYSRAFMNGEGSAKLKIFRDTADTYQLVYESAAVSLRPGLNIIGVDADVKRGDLLGIYLESGDVEADRKVGSPQSAWRKGDSGTAPKGEWVQDNFCFSVDGLVR